MSTLTTEVLAEKSNNMELLKSPMVITAIVAAVLCGLVFPMFNDSNEISIDQYQSLSTLVTSYPQCPVLSNETTTALGDKKISSAEFKKILAVSAPCTNPEQIKALTSIVAKR